MYSVLRILWFLGGRGTGKVGFEFDGFALGRPPASPNDRPKLQKRVPESRPAAGRFYSSSFIHMIFNLFQPPSPFTPTQSQLLSNLTSTVSSHLFAFKPPRPAQITAWVSTSHTLNFSKTSLPAVRSLAARAALLDAEP